MAKLILPPGWPDPYSLLRDIEWEKHYPMLLLRGIYDRMERGRREEEKSPKALSKRRKEAEAHAKSKGKPMPGDQERRYVAGFNIVVYSLTMATPPRLFPGQVKKGLLNMESLTTRGKEREAEVVGLRELSATSRDKYGKISRQAMSKNTREKLKQLRRLIDTVRATTKEEGMPQPGASL